jgi:hypothetical protein
LLFCRKTIALQASTQCFVADNSMLFHRQLNAFWLTTQCSVAYKAMTHSLQSIALYPYKAMLLIVQNYGSCGIKLSFVRSEVKIIDDF